MKKLLFVLVLFFIVMGGVGLFAQNRLTVNLADLEATRNPTAFTRNYDFFVIHFPEFPENINWSNFNRVIVRVKYYRANGNEIRQGHGMAITSIFYDYDAASPNIFNAGANVPAREDNIGLTGPNAISRDGGQRITLNRAPGGIVLQNADEAVRFVELVEVTFFRAQ